ncbi:hypothetical protein Tco_0062484 [Tanacetum coccineum]
MVNDGLPPLTVVDRHRGPQATTVDRRCGGTWHSNNWYEVLCRYEVRVTGGRVAEPIIGVQGTVATFGSEPIVGVMIKLSFEVVGKQKDRNAVRSGALIGGWLEMTKLPLPLGGYIITRKTTVGCVRFS